MPGVGPGIEELDRSREAMRRRIALLDRQNAKTAKELQEILLEQVKLGKAITRTNVIIAVMKCFENLVRRTPVDTGRLRAGWQFSGNVGDIEWKAPPNGNYDEFKNSGAIERAIQSSIRNSVFGETDTLYVFNNVEYLLSLNAGWSRKQAGNFIDLFLQELKSVLEKLAAASNRS